MTDLQSLLATARTYREAGSWATAAKLYATANEMDAASWEVKHNLALCRYALGETDLAIRYTAEALSLKRDLWQSHMLQARILKDKGRIEDCETALRGVIRYSPTNGPALLMLADIEMNEFGDPLSAASRVAPLLGQAQHRADAELTILMSKLYDRDESDEELSAALIAFARANLTLPGFRFSADAVRRAASVRRDDKPRIGLLSPLFCQSPVYYLTFGALRPLADKVDIVVFNRGAREDYATRSFHSIAREWCDVRHLGAEALANEIKSRAIDVMFDLGGWSDPVGMKALSAKPAPVQYKWVGGQSATTGLDCFDGFLTDAQHSPAGAERLHTEPLIRLAGGYVSYESDIPAAAPGARKSVATGDDLAVASNPAKLSRAFLRAAGKAASGRKSGLVFIDRRFTYARARDRVLDALPKAARRRTRFEAPASRADYIARTAEHRRFLDPFPYSGGLTMLELLRQGAEVEVVGGTDLFSSRHGRAHLAHAKRHKSHRRMAGDLAHLIGGSVYPLDGRQPMIK